MASCPKCGNSSGDYWVQCDGQCPIPSSPHYDPSWGKHDWISYHGLECCKTCGFVRRADDKNKPCRGPVRIVCKSDPEICL